MGGPCFLTKKKLGLDYRCNNKPLSMIFVGSLFRWVDFCCWGTTYKKKALNTTNIRPKLKRDPKSESTKIGHNLKVNKVIYRQNNVSALVYITIALI